MRSSEGIKGIHPTIKKVGFEHRGKISIHLEDGRVIIAPLKLYPSIAKLSPSERRNYTIGDGEVIVFRNADEVYHIEQFLGRPEDYEYDFKQGL